MPDTKTPEMPSEDALLDAILPHVPFDGWSATALSHAAAELDLTPTQIRQLAPRGATGLAEAYHMRGDARMTEAMKAADLAGYRYRDKVAHALWLRLQVIDDPEAVQRASALFALPHMAPRGSRLIWHTADAIWNVLGDTSEDSNWYSKRATLSAVWTSVLLYWLGDASPSKEATRAFIDRRIDNVMQIEKAKATVRENPVLRTAFLPITFAASFLKAPKTRGDLPGQQP